MVAAWISGSYLHNPTFTRARRIQASITTSRYRKESLASDLRGTMKKDDRIAEIKPVDLRGILKYVPLFRDHVFVIAIDGSVIDDNNFSNLLLDIAVLRSLNIQIAIVFGIGKQLRQSGENEKVAISDAYGEGIIDDKTLALAVKSAAQVSHSLMQGLSKNGIKCSLSNAVRATEVGIIGGIDQINRGKVDRIDVDFIRNQLQKGVLPVISPLAFSRIGETLRINSDLLASELAISLEASKLIYISLNSGLSINSQFIRNITLKEIQNIFDTNKTSIEEKVRSKTYQSMKAIEGGVPRAHLIDGRLYDGLLTEIFSSVGIGTMIHGNEYQQIRKARSEDVQFIFNITKSATKDELLKSRSYETINAEIDCFYVYEIDGSIVACACLNDYPENNVVELAAVNVLPFYQGKGVGKKLVEFACLEAANQGRNKIFALTTQSFSFFHDVCGFTEGTKKDLPEDRLKTLIESNRNSRILFKNI